MPYVGHVHRAESDYPPLGMLGPRAIAWWALRTMTDGVRLDGVDNVPDTGGVLLVARHYHHLLDGAVLVQHLERPVHIVVGLDWAANGAQRFVMEQACASAEWPVILRPRTARNPSEVQRYLRSGLRFAGELLARDRVVAMFPEGYPAIDPTPAQTVPRDRDADGMLPFASGYRAVASMAPNARIVPVGFAYEPRGRKWRITARFGAALPASAEAATVEAAVRERSRPG